MAPSCPIRNVAGWQEVRLADIARKIGSGATPRGGAETYLSARVEFALIRSQNVLDRSFDRDGLAYISNQQAEGLRSATVESGDVLLNITGDGITFGRACIVPDNVRPACVNQHVSIVRVAPEIADSGFVLAFLTHPDVKLYIESFNAGGSRRAITKGHIESFRLPLPPMRIQRAIAHVLGTLDDKIELNRRMNETLEEMARALFKNWFVDFDPVHAKAAGKRPYGMDEATAALFPDSFEESELGPVPRGWIRADLSYWAEVSSGGTPTKASPELWCGEIPWISPKSMTEIHVDDSADHVSLSAIGRGTRLAPAGATLVMVRGMGLHNKVRVSQALRDVTFNQDVKAFVGRKIEPTLLLYSLLSAQEELLRRVESSGHGTGTLPSEILLSRKLAMPAEGAQIVLAKHINALNAKMASNLRESKLLATVRDALLPRLLSGELRVGKAEKTVMEAL